MPASPLSISWELELQKCIPTPTVVVVVLGILGALWHPYPWSYFFLTKEGVYPLEGLQLHTQQPGPLPGSAPQAWVSLTLWAGRRRASNWLCWAAVSYPGRDKVKVHISAQLKARGWCELGTTPKPLCVFAECEGFLTTVLHSKLHQRNTAQLGARQLQTKCNVGKGQAVWKPHFWPATTFPSRELKARGIFSVPSYPLYPFTAIPQANAETKLQEKQANLHLHSLLAGLC